jgi:D-serine deaminase-like pyridoxal phosphate-dependent protein
MFFGRRFWRRAESRHAVPVQHLSCTWTGGQQSRLLDRLTPLPNPATNVSGRLGPIKFKSRFFEPSLYVWATAISRPAEDRAIVDAGLKALAFRFGAAARLR